MDIILLIIGALLGGLISWGITYAYYKKADRDQHIVYNKLSSGLRDVIREDQRSKLTVRELNELLEKRTIDPNSSDPLPFLACPQCGSKNLGHLSATDYEHDETYYMIKCNTCGWSEWTQ